MTEQNYNELKRKVILIGRPETGKSSIKKVVFEGQDPMSLLSEPLAPTRGFEPSVHTWFDLTIGLIDTSGQEIDTFLTRSEEQQLTFQNSDLIIYVFDYNGWLIKKEDIFEDLNVIASILQNLNINANLTCFCHKIDLIEQNIREQEIREIKSQIKIPTFFTSIKPELLYRLYEAFHELLTIFSREFGKIKKILDEKLSDFPKSLFFITNKNNNIIVQTSSKDFNFKNINYLHYLTAMLNVTLEKIRANDKIDHLILQTQKHYNIILKYLELSEYDLKNLICISETLNSNKLIWLVGEISLQLNRMYKMENS